MLSIKRACVILKIVVWSRCIVLFLYQDVPGQVLVCQRYTLIEL